MNTKELMALADEVTDYAFVHGLAQTPAPRMNIGALAAALDAETKKAFQDVLELTQLVEYMVGIAERGLGRKCEDHELPQKFLLDYVKSLEAKNGFDAWKQNQYTKVLEKSIAEDYVPIDAALTQATQPAPSPMTAEEYVRLTENGAKAWAGVNAQDLRDGDEPAPSTAGEVLHPEEFRFPFCYDGNQAYTPTTCAAAEKVVPVSTLQSMWKSIDVDKEQPGYHWRKGWNDALRQAMDYATLLSSPALPVPSNFPTKIMELLVEMTDRVGSEFKGPWEDGNGEPLQDDADAAVAWIKSRALPVGEMTEIDWKDQYEKQKRRAEMWIAKYEKGIGPLQRVYPASDEHHVAELKAVSLMLRKSDSPVTFNQKKIAIADAIDAILAAARTQPELVPGRNKL